MNSAGIDESSVTVLAASSAVAEVPGGMTTPSIADACSGSATQLKLSATVVAVRGSPSAHVMPSRSVNSRFPSGVSSHVSASPGRGSASSVLRFTSGSYMNRLTCRLERFELVGPCGSKFWGSAFSVKLNVPPPADGAPPAPDAAGPDPSAASASGAESESPPPQAATESPMRTVNGMNDFLMAERPPGAGWW
jgi:hypothetical protein